MLRQAKPGLESWYAIRAKAYFREIDEYVDLRTTIVTKYDVATKSTVVLLKHRSANDLLTKLKCDLRDLVRHLSNKRIAHNPFGVTLLHFSCTAQ